VDKLVKANDSSGVCQTDLHRADDNWPVKPTLPFIPGHEGAGFVVSLGQGVKRLEDGDRVGTVPERRGSEPHGCNNDNNVGRIVGRHFGAIPSTP